MLLYLAAWCVAGLVLVLLGAAVAALVGWPEWMTRSSDRFFATAMLGLLAGGSVALSAALITPLQPWLLALPLILLAWPQVRRALLASIPVAPVCGLLAGYAFTLACFESVWEPLYDTALYHTQLTDWMSAEGLPPGIGLLYYRLGFSSSWLALGSLLNHGPGFHRMGRWVTGFALVIMLTQTTLAFIRSIWFRGDRRDWFLIGAMPLVMAIACRDYMNSSPSPNLGVAMALVFIGWLVLDGVNAMALAAAGGAVAVKMSAAPALGVVFHRAKWPVWILSAALCASLFLANYRTTGCPAFPSAILCSGAPHSVGSGEATRVALETLNFARDRSGDMAAPYGDVSWIRRWLGHIDNQRIYVPSVLGLLALLLTRTWNRAATLGLVAGLYCLATAPGPRFAFGAAAALTGAGAVALMRWRVSRILMLCCSAGVLLSVASVEAGYTFEAFVGRNTWVTPAPSYLHDAVGRVIWHRGLKVNLPPADDRCGALPVPCTPIPPLPATTLCDVQRGLSGGFCRVVLDRHSVKPDSENTRSPNTDPASAAR